MRWKQKDFGGFVETMRKCRLIFLCTAIQLKWFTCIKSLDGIPDIELEESNDDIEGRSSTDDEEVLVSLQ